MKEDPNMRYFSADEISNALTWESVIEQLQEGFTQSFVIPPRMHLDYDGGSSQNTLLLMPAVCIGDLAGVKIVNVAPENAARSLPAIQGVYYLLDAVTGVPKVIMDARTLTNWRTAGASALATRYLAPPDARKLLMVGTGSLAPFLIEAHASVRPVEEVFIYGRSPQKAATLAEQQEKSGLKISVVEDLASAAAEADIISVATLSNQPLIKGSWLRPGQHVDLVGSFKPAMREADDEVLRRASIYVDTLEMAPRESGDLVIPLKEGTIQMSDIQGDLFQLCRAEVRGRQRKDEITVFKSVGHALEDLVTARLVYNLSFQNQKK